MAPADPDARLFHWPEDLLTGVPVLDDQHRQIHRTLISLLQTLDSGSAAPGDLASRVEQLQDGIQEHFATEEALLSISGYALLHLHEAEHAAQVERMRELQRTFSRPGAPPLRELVLRLLDMLLDHVRTVDMDYAPHLRVRVPQ